MIFGLGTDIVPVDRIRQILERNPRALPAFILSKTELALYKAVPAINQLSFIVKRVAAKEALSKAFGTGIRDLSFWKDYSVINDNSGKPTIVGAIDYNCFLTYSDIPEYVVATVILEYI